MTDPAFQTWLGTLPGLGYEPDWIRHNMPALRKAYEAKGGAPLAPCPHRRKPVDRYGELG